MKVTTHLKDIINHCMRLEVEVGTSNSVPNMFKCWQTDQYQWCKCIPVPRALYKGSQNMSYILGKKRSSTFWEVPFVTLEHLFITIFMGPGNIAYFANIVPPQGYHTEGIINRFQSNFIYLKLPYWMRTIFCRFMHNTCSHISYVSWYSRAGCGDWWTGTKDKLPGNR